MPVRNNKPRKKKSDPLAKEMQKPAGLVLV